MKAHMGVSFRPLNAPGGYIFQGVTFFLQHVQNGIKVGMVRFARSASTLWSLTEMSDANRQQIIDAVPTSTLGSTSIGAGMYACVYVILWCHSHGRK